MTELRGHLVGTTLRYRRRSGGRDRCKMCRTRHLMRRVPGLRAASSYRKRTNLISTWGTSSRPTRSSSSKRWTRSSTTRSLLRTTYRKKWSMKCPSSRTRPASSPKLRGSKTRCSLALRNRESCKRHSLVNISRKDHLLSRGCNSARTVQSNRTSPSPWLETPFKLVKSS